MAQPGPNGPSGSSQGKVLAAIGGVIVVALIGAIGYIALSDRDEVADPNPADTTSPITTDDPATSDGPTPTEAVDEPVTTDAPKPAGTSELTDVQKQAAKQARDRLEDFPESRAGLIKHLTNSSEPPYSEEDAAAAVDSLGVDWDVQALELAKISISVAAHSKSGLIDDLSSEETAFTVEQATKAVENLDVDWSAQPERFARDFAGNIAVSRDLLLGVMRNEQFEQAEAEAGIDAANIDFNAEAAEAAERSLKFDPSQTCAELTDNLTRIDRFTAEEAVYGAGSTSVC